MKICLIDPPLFSEDLAGATKSMGSVANLIPALGLAYLAAVLEKNKYAVKIIDCTLDITHLQLIEILRKEKPDIVGITATTAAFASAKKAAENIKEHFPETVVVIGGAHVTAAADETMKSGYFDIGVIGEGEDTFLDLIRHIEIRGLDDPGAIEGIIYRKNGKVCRTSARKFITDLDALPFPARHLLPPLRAYRPTPASYRKLPLGAIMTSRGCPSRCTFCDRSVFGSTYRERSIANVIGEVEELLHRFKAKEIRFFDDTFTLNEKRVYGLCDALDRKKLKFPWTCLTKVNNISKDLLRRMKQSGCWQVLFGLESGDESILRSLKKENTLEQNERAVRLAREAGLSVRADFIVGTPGETPESLRRTLDFAIRSKVDYAHFNKFVPFPGTEIYNTLIRQGYKFDFTDKYSIIDHSAILFVPEAIAREDFKDFLDYANRAFYLRPAYILKRLFSLRSLAELRGQVKGFFAIYNLN